MRIFVACLSKVGVKGGGVGVGNPGDLSLNCHLYLLYRKFAKTIHILHLQVINSENMHRPNLRIFRPFQTLYLVVRYTFTSDSQMTNIATDIEYWYIALNHYLIFCKYIYILVRTVK